MPAPSPLSVGISGVCPRCGRGKIFVAFLTLRDACPACGLDLRGHDAGDGPAVFVILGIGALILPMALFVEFRFEPALWVHVVLWIPITLVLTMVPLRVIKGILVAQQFRHRSTALDDGT